MKTIFNNKMGHRERDPHCILVTFNGDVHVFKGNSIEGVCHAEVIDSEKNGKWSNVTFEIQHLESTTVVQWMDDFQTGRAFPQPSWEEGCFWLARQAPMLSKDGFDKFIRDNFSGVAKRWDAVKMAEKEFGLPLTSDQIEKIKNEKLRIEAEKAAYEAELKIKMDNSPFSKLLFSNGKKQMDLDI